MKRFVTFMFLLLLGIGYSLGQSTTLISPTGEGGFENGSTLAANNWTAANASPDSWVVGAVPTPSAGTNCAYISADGGTGWTYTLFSNYQHVYHDFTIPAGQSKVYISFKWKANGEGSTSDYDNLKVFFAPNTVTPVAGSAVSNTYQIGATWYNLSYSSWNVVTNLSVNATPGSTYRVIFSWKADVSGTYNPPASIDEVSVVSQVPPPPLIGTKTIDPATGDYTTFAAAISALNDAGVGSGGVTFLVTDGTTFNETQQTITATGTASNPIIFQKSGTGTKPIVNFTGTSATNNFCFKLSSCDYITFDGLDLRDAGTSSTNYTE